MTNKTGVRSADAALRVLTDRAGSWDPFYDGEWQTPSSEERFEVFNPANGNPIASVSSASQLDVDAAIASAEHAFRNDWSLRPPKERAVLLRSVAEVIREHADEIGELTTLENGKPFRDARRRDANAASHAFDYFAGQVDLLEGRVIDQGSVEANVVYEPFGVAAAIIPFNWPPMHFGTKCAPALMAGNTVVLKPGDQAPLAALRLVELANQVLPAGVLNAVSGTPAGAMLAEHRGISRVMFTGSTATGRKIMTSVSNNLAVPTMELGGKNALIVCDDADLDLALRTALESMFFNKGEACTSTSRILLHESIHDEFLERYARAVERFVVGDGLVEATDIGPAVDARQRERVLSYIEIGKEQGARLVTQATVPVDPELKDGYWVPPTVFADVRADMRIAQEEIFGPVSSVLRYANDDEAVAIANGTPYGLTAAVITQNLTRAKWFARRLEAGIVFVNNYERASMDGSGFGGVKDSGFGREMSPLSLLECVQTKNIRLPGSKPPIVWASAERVLR
jgi:acyl-CoA reductase-like NAD-dependent aldehyde dehydrogenase